MPPPIPRPIGVWLSVRGPGTCSGTTSQAPTASWGTSSGPESPHLRPWELPALSESGVDRGAGTRWQEDRKESREGPPRERRGCRGWGGISGSSGGSGHGTEGRKLLGPHVARERQEGALRRGWEGQGVRWSWSAGKGQEQRQLRTRENMTVSPLE